MPRLLLFAPCDRVIFGIGDQAASLILILHALQTYSEPIPTPNNPLYRFSVFSQWYRTPGDEGKTFEQRVAMACGSETPVLENITAFQMPTQMHRIATHFNKLPPFKPGEYDLKILIRTQGEPQWSQPIAIYPMSITELPKSEKPIQ
jgi:hypothetical protein